MPCFLLDNNDFVFCDTLCLFKNPKSILLEYVFLFVFFGREAVTNVFFVTRSLLILLGATMTVPKPQSSHWDTHAIQVNAFSPLRFHKILQTHVVSHSALHIVSNQKLYFSLKLTGKSTISAACSSFTFFCHILLNSGTPSVSHE